MNEMKRIFLLLFILITVKALSQSPDSMRRYIDNVFSQDSLITVEYGRNAGYSGIKDTLFADIYSPSNDTTVKRAMIIIMHGGGFVAGNRHEPAMVFVCDKLVKKGYVVASIDYRRGLDRTKPRTLYLAVLRAVQDLNGFIRYAKANAENFNIDTNKIFVTGSSAGGIVVLQKAYMKIDSVSMSLMNIQSLKDIEGNDNNLPNSSAIAGVYSMWGAIFDTSWIQKGDVPVGCVQSLYDHTIPWNAGKSFRSNIFMLYGSNSIYARALNQGITTTLHGYGSEQHDLGIKVSPFRDSTIQLMSNFFYQILTLSNQNDSIQQKDENTVVQRTYLVKTEGRKNNKFSSSTALGEMKKNGETEVR